jgi:hypothetical protein
VSTSKYPQEKLYSSENRPGNLVLFMAVLVNLKRTFAFCGGRKALLRAIIAGP